MNHVLKGSSRTDLLCIPAIMLGFHPQDSCVVIALKGAAVAMCARVDLRWFAGDAERTLRQLNNALGNVPEARIVLVGFGDPDDASISVAELADALGLAEAKGALVTDVPEGPAAEAGMQSGDVIVSFDGVDVGDTRGLVRQVGNTEVGKSVPVTVFRGGKTETIEIVLGRRETGRSAADDQAVVNLRHGEKPRWSGRRHEGGFLRRSKRLAPPGLPL